MDDNILTNRDARLRAALLYAGPGAMLSHETAAEIDGLGARPSALIHLTIHVDREVRPVPGLRLHRSRHPRGLNCPAGGLSRTRIEDTILDLADAMSGLDEIRALMTAAIRRRKTSAEKIRAALAGRGLHRWRRAINELLTAGIDGAHSVLEFRHDQDADQDAERAHGLPGWPGAA